MNKIYYKDIKYTNGYFGETTDGNIFFISDHSRTPYKIAIYQDGEYDYLIELWNEKQVKYLETYKCMNSFNQFKALRNDKNSNCISEVVYEKENDNKLLEKVEEYLKDVKNIQTTMEVILETLKNKQGGNNE